MASLAMEDITNENDDDRFEMFDLSMSVVTLLDYIKHANHLKRYFEDIDTLSSKVRDDCRKEKSNVEKIKRYSRKLEKENDWLRRNLELTNSQRQRYRKERDDLREELHNHMRLPANDHMKLEEAEEELNNLRQDIQRQMMEDAKRIKDFESASNEIIDSQRQKVKHLERELSKRELKIKELNDMLTRSKIGVSDRAGTHMNVLEKDEEISILRDHLQQTLTKLNESEAELEETKTRLSKAMGDRLTDNNPNIADLSDKNRPTKLAERFTELYDNQWTDAFDFIDRYFQTEENTIETLLKILQDVMNFCKRKGHEQMEDLQSVLEFSGRHEHTRISGAVPKQLKDCRKSLSSAAFMNLYEMYVTQLRQSKDQASTIALEVGSFTKECIAVCWFMVIQDPPIVFAPLVNRGSRFNTDLFKPYTSSGTHVDYVVWPALLLHKDGPVLAKGVAQGYGKKFRNDKTDASTAAAFADKDMLQRLNKEQRYVGDKNRDFERRDKNNKIASKSDEERQRFGVKGTDFPKFPEYTANTPRTFRQDGDRNKIPLGFDMVNPYYSYVNAHGWESFRNGIGQQAYQTRHKTTH